jgi:MFS transporter, FSR family, fosmidomycin resistance protein
MCGKIAGGFLADRIGYKRYTIYALLLAIPFLTMLKKNIIAMSIGVFLLQSTIPSTTVMVLKAIKRKPAVAISLSFGISILAAIAVFYTPLKEYFDNGVFIGSVLLGAVGLLVVYEYVVFRKTQKCV